MDRQPPESPHPSVEIREMRAFVAPPTDRLGLARQELIGNSASVAFLEWIGMPAPNWARGPWLRAGGRDGRIVRSSGSSSSLWRLRRCCRVPRHGGLTTVPPRTTRTGPRTTALLALVAAVALAAGCALPSAGWTAAPGASTTEPIPGAPARPTGPTDDAVLVRVVDGDTIRVRIDGVEEPVRYIGIDTPEPNPTSAATPEPFADEATAANRRLLEGGGRLLLERDVSERDRFGRLLRHVWTQDDEGWTLVNLALVAEGYAQVSTFPPDVRYADVLVAAQRAAREAGRGLWGVP